MNNSDKMEDNDKKDQSKRKNSERRESIVMQEDEESQQPTTPKKKKLSDEENSFIELQRRYHQLLAIPSKERSEDEGKEYKKLNPKYCKQNEYLLQVK